MFTSTLLFLSVLLAGFAIGAIFAKAMIGPPDVPGTIELQSEDELCGPQVFAGSNGELKAQIWRGDPDTCRPLD